MESGLGRKTFFITLGSQQGHDSSGRDDKVVFGKLQFFQSMRGLLDLYPEEGMHE
jgi:hypothetical protein